MTQATTNGWLTIWPSGTHPSDVLDLEPQTDACWSLTVGSDELVFDTHVQRDGTVLFTGIRPRNDQPQ